MSDPVLIAHGLSFRHAEAAALFNGLDLSIPKGQLTALVGPNGSGKSTLLSLLAGIVRPDAGKVTLRGEDLCHIPPRQIAKSIGLLPQSPDVADGLHVSELLALGRTPHRRFYELWRQEDQAALDRAAAAAGIVELLDRPLSALSGGQRQRAFIAMALTQEPDVILLDEPTSYLDISHQISILKLLRHRVERQQNTVVVSMHDIAQAAQFADRIVVMREGAIFDEGLPEDVVTPALFDKVFGLPVKVLKEAETGLMVVVPKELRKDRSR